MARALITWAAALVACASIVFFAPSLAEASVPLLGDRLGQNMAAVESLYTLIIFAPILAVAAGAARVAGVNPVRPGAKPGAMMTIGLLIGSGGILAAAAFARLAGVLGPGGSSDGAAGTLILGSVVILFAASVEEIYFRGWLQPALERDLGLPAAILLSAAAFAALHVMGGARSPATLLNLFLGGLLFGLLAARGGGIAGAVGAHFAWNWTEQIALGLEPNPGLGSFGALTDLELAGPALWGGSAEGLNASVAMTVALLAMLVPLLMLMREQLLPAAPSAHPAAAE